MAEFDLVVRGGTVVTAADTWVCDVGVRNGKIAALGDGLRDAARTVDATGKYVLPGGIDAHVHIEQDSPETGARPGTDFYTTTVSAACGGTTTLIPFARQIKGESLRAAVEAYRRKPIGKAVIDYAIHLIIADPTAQVLGQEVPSLIEEGYTSIKVYMTYKALMLSDHEILEVMSVARRHGAMMMIHAENADCIVWLTGKLLESGRVAPKFKGIAHQPPVEREAAHRAITLGEIADVPILIVHVATGEAAETIRWAQSRGLKVYGETCPQYLFLNENDLDKDGMEGAKCICAPPPGTPENQAALWHAMETGVFHVYSSDHAAFRYDDPQGKLVHGPNPPFNRITNGVPGVETRLPLLFSRAVTTGGIDLNQVVAVSATNPAKIYGLYPRKGTIGVGSDADFAVWDADRRTTISIAGLHDGMDYTPYDGLDVQGWPEVTVSRGEIIWHDGEFVGKAGRGEFLPCDRPNPVNDRSFLDDAGVPQG